MAIAGNGSYVPAIRVYVRHRRLIHSGIAHNVPRSVLWQPLDAAARFIDDPMAYIYVPTMENGGTHYLCALLVELGIIDEYRTDTSRVSYYLADARPRAKVTETT